MAIDPGVGVQLRHMNIGSDLSSSADPISNHGLDFRPVARQLFNDHRVFTHAENPTSRENARVPEQLYFLDLLSSGDAFQSAASSSEPEESASMQGKVTFMCGYSASAQLATLSNTNRIGLEAWRRHSGSLFSRSYTDFEDTKLPSVACNIVQLRFWTIGSRSDDIANTRQAVDLLRKDAISRMGAYRDRLREDAEWRPGDSIVRRYEVHDQNYFSIEQLVTIYVTTHKEAEDYAGRPHWHGTQTLQICPS